MHNQFIISYNAWTDIEINFISTVLDACYVTVTKFSMHIRIAHGNSFDTTRRVFYHVILKYSNDITNSCMYNCITCRSLTLRKGDCRSRVLLIATKINSIETHVTILEIARQLHSICIRFASSWKLKRICDQIQHLILVIWC